MCFSLQPNSLLFRWLENVFGSTENSIVYCGAWEMAASDSLRIFPLSLFWLAVLFILMKNQQQAYYNCKKTLSVAMRLISNDAG